MERLTQLIEAIHSHPMLGLGIAVAVIGVIVLLRRKPQLQRDADARLAALRRDKNDQYTALRPPR